MDNKVFQGIKNEKEAREAFLKGVNITNDLAKVTLGPQGRHIISNHINGQMWATKDGAKVIREIRLADKYQDAGVRMIRDAAQKTANSAGDATTTTCILAAAMMNAANEAIQNGQSPIAVKDEIELIVKEAVRWIADNSVKINGDVEKIKQIATISSNNNIEIGTLIADAFAQIGEDGQIDLRKSQINKTFMEVLGGFYFPKGMMHPYFITNPAKAECVLEGEVLIMVYDKVISKVEDILPALNYAVVNDKPLLLICSHIEGEALATVVQNKEQGKLKICVVQAPESGAKRYEMMQDIAVFTGGKIISEDNGRPMSEFNHDWLGLCEKVVIGKNKTIVINGQGNPEEIKDKAEEIKQGIAEAVSDFEREYLRSRAASMGKGVAILHIAAATEIETDANLDLAEDSILAVRSALEEGYLPGGGITYFKISETLLETSTLATSLRAPFKQILENSSMELTHEYIDYLSLEDNYGYNAKSDRWQDMVEAGIIEPAKVIRNAVENAGSAAVMFCNIGGMIAEVVGNGIE